MSDQTPESQDVITEMSGDNQSGNTDHLISIRQFMEEGGNGNTPVRSVPCPVYVSGNACGH